MDGGLRSAVLNLRGMPAIWCIGSHPNRNVMKKRPLAIAVLGWLFIAVGSASLIHHLSEVNAQNPFEHGLAWVCLVQALAIVGGAFMLRGLNWARRLLAGWMGFHIVLGLFHSPVELVLHILLFGFIGYFLFRPRASAYFQSRTSAPPKSPDTTPPSLDK
jgi:hypothetical protein